MCNKDLTSFCAKKDVIEKGQRCRFLILNIFLSALAVASMFHIQPISAKGYSQPIGSTTSSTPFSLTNTPSISPTITSTLALTATSTLSTSTPSATATPQILITGNRSTLHLSANASSIWDEVEYVCMTFEIIPVGDLKNVYIIGQGLGQISFRSVAAGSEIICTEKNDTGTIGYLNIPSLNAPERIFVQVDRLSLPEPGSKLSGTIKVYADGISPTEILLQVEQPPYKGYWTAFGWLLRYLLPAMLGIAAYWLRKSIDNRLSDRRALIDFRKTHTQKLRDFFTITYVEILQRHRSNAKEFADNLKQELDKRKILDKLPQKECDKLRQVFETANHNKIISALIDIFADNRTDIESAEEQYKDH